MSEALQATLPSIAPAAPAATAEDVSAVVGVLLESKGWLSRRALAAALNWPGEAGLRRLRRVADAAAPRIVSWPGSPGYILRQFATEPELDRCEDATASQIKAMQVRWTSYRRARHVRNPIVPDPTAVLL